MEKLNFDTGVRAFRLPGGGVLRFNPADPNLYSRFYGAEEKLAQLQSQVTENAEGKDTVALLADADRQLKSLFAWLLGGDNDMDKALGGISLLAVCADGRTVAANLLSALEQVLEQGAKQLVESRAAAL